MKVAVIFGTRSEGIKMASIMASLQQISLWQVEAYLRIKKRLIQLTLF
ncbi:hypothetical protein IQ283_02390 [Alkalihalobacillus hwajinpoensis]|nr:hypothetical protein [Pseudalkalibacillus hwajinpoensis]MBF0705440.1 hypothetical protein [Pseudalkalibacillus hwajinpoensis]